LNDVYLTMKQIITRLRKSKLKQVLNRKFLEKSRYLSTEVKKDLSEKEKKENARWAMGFFGVIMAANCFTVWQEWDALSVKKDDVKLIDTSKNPTEGCSDEIELS
jgi:hypothetical protein